MCRSQAEGGRRCAGSRSGSHAAGERESYEDTPWQGYDEYMQRSAELDRRIAGGESITGIMRQEQLKRGEERIAQIMKQGW
jgi:hypothetical protein